MSLSRFIVLLVLAGVTYAQTAQSPTTRSQKQNPEAEKERSGYDPLLDLPPLPEGKLTLVGGTVSKVDPISDRLEVRDFGGGKTNIAFDLRTKILRNGAPATVKDIQPGYRVYVDTMLKGDEVFAKTIRLETSSDQGDARGQVVAVNTERGILKLQEEVAPEPFQFRLTPDTTVTMNGRRANASEVLPGALVAIRFAGGGNGSVAREVRVLANPGENFTFVGKITFLDLRLKRLAVANQSDGETYDISLDQLALSESRGLRVGSDAVVKAVFNGKSYEAQKVEVSAPGKREARQ
ncbi:MAG TPA: hypothetical protein VMT53_24715 [Terriglobales bacterium]|nr:hypothetical protein [Terriglobales bacterium]